MPAAVSAGCAVFIGMNLLVSAIPDTVYALMFCRVPTWLAAAFFHAGVDGATLVLGSGRIVSVTRECGGSDFFALVCAVLTWHAVRQKGAAALPFWWCGAWIFAVLANGMRVILTVWTRAFAELFLPERFFGAAHLVSGVLVFFPALFFLWCFCVRHDLSESFEAGSSKLETDPNSD